MIFDVKTPEDYFYHIQRSIDKYKLDTNKKIERLFFIINGLNHLREWIAPEYKPYFQDRTVNPPKGEKQVFSKEIYDLPQHEIIRDVCNGIKHLRKQKNELKTSYILNVDDVLNVDVGVPSDFFVDSISIIELIEEVARYYDRKWFHGKKEENGVLQKR